MSRAGIGVMLQQLSGNSESVEAFRAAIGKTIAKAELTAPKVREGYGSEREQDALVLTFDDGTAIRFSDEGQSCCESRYMRTDDELPYYVGAKLTGAELRDAPNVTDDEYGEHEVQFLAVQTDRGEFVLSSHNEHNGYYGGFAIRVSAVLP